jgi:hypothetical protein
MRGKVSRIGKCPANQHAWGPVERIKDRDFGVVFAYVEVCLKCGWRRYENICETRASGGRQQILPPEGTEESDG